MIRREVLVGLINGVLARLGTDGKGLAPLLKTEQKKRVDLQAAFALARAVKLELSNPLTPLIPSR